MQGDTSREPGGESAPSIQQFSGILYAPKPLGSHQELRKPRSHLEILAEKKNHEKVALHCDKSVTNTKPNRRATFEHKLDEMFQTDRLAF